MPNNIKVEVVHTPPDQQLIHHIELPANSTIRAAIIQTQMFTDVDQLNVGIFGKIRSLDFTLQDGDRIEIYRPLYIDPKDARVKRVTKERLDKNRRKQLQKNRKY